MSNKLPEAKASVRALIPYEVPLFPKEYELKLDANENTFGCSAKVFDALKNLTVKEISKYPHYGRLTQKIADYTGTKVDNIKVTNGADEALYSLMQTYLADDDVMITVSPSFSMPKLYAKIVGAKVIEIPYKQKWQFPAEDFLKAIETNEKIKIVHLTSPNNPTGECISQEIVKKILNAAQNKLIIFDETYASYCDYSMIPEVQNYDNIAVVKSLSKDFALAGLRIGYIVTHPERIKLLKTVVSPYSVNIAAAVAAEAALSDINHLNKIKSEINKSKKILTEGLKALDFEVYPSESNFILFNAGEKAEYVHHTLLKNGIKVRNFSDKDMQDFIRITIPDSISAEKIINLLQPKKTLIFDMDGVLVDVSNSYRTTIKNTYEHFAHKSLDYNVISDAKKLGGLNNDWDLTEYLLKKDGVKVDKNELIEVFEKIYFDNGNGLIMQENFLLNQNLIKELSKKYNLAIFTGRPETEALYTLNKEKVSEYFYPIITMDSIPLDKQKPHNFGIEKIKNKLFSTEIFYFGDTKDDMICAKSANVKAIGVLSPQNQNEKEKEHLYNNGADFVLSSVNDILTVIERESNAQCSTK